VILYGANPILEQIAEERSSRVILPQMRDISTNLLGEHQLSNARIAYEAGIWLDIPESMIQQALLHVEHRGRLQYLTPNLLIDGAHNLDGMRRLREYLDRESREVVYCVNLKS
jgi:dihydrofolate synthase / folylpolyglutamate synthase